MPTRVAVVLTAYLRQGGGSLGRPPCLGPGATLSVLLCEHPVESQRVLRGQLTFSDVAL